LAVVIKGVSCAGARRLAVHLQRTDTNERAEVREIRGVAAEDLRGALIEMEALGAGTRATKLFYHASINTPAHERMTEAQRDHAIDQLEKALGLTDQPRVVVVHEKEGREHCHIVWSRVDVDTMRVISDSHNYRKHEQVARDLEREFGHERVQGAHIERDGKERPARTPSHAEMLQAERTGLSAKEAKQQITKIWQQADSGQAFAVALWQNGFVLARGDQRDFVVIDPYGGTHSLARRIEGVKAKDVRERMSDLDPARLPDVQDAKRVQSIRYERDQAENEKRRTDPLQYDPDVLNQEGRRQGGPEWTGRAGMFEQQRSAFEWMKDNHEERMGRREQTDRRQEKSEERQKAEERYQTYMRNFGKEIEPEQEEDFDRGRGRDRGRREE
jgi:hypothetical protein